MGTVALRRPELRVSAPIHALGLTVVLLGVVHVLVDDDSLWLEIAESFILFSFAAAVFWVGRRMSAEAASTGDTLRLLTVSLAGGLLVGVLSATFVLARLISAESIAEWDFILSIGWSIGIAAGALVAFYDKRVRRGMAEQEGLAKRLTILQRVLRHNLRNELTIIGGATEGAQRLAETPELKAKLDLIDRHVERVLRLSDQSQRLTRIWQTEDRVRVDADEVVRQEVDRFRSTFPDVPVSADLETGITVRAHPDVGLAVREALENAALHNEDVDIAVSVRTAGREGSTAIIEIRDTGSGIPATELAPLWATGERPLEHTTGLGLWLIYWLAESSGGELSVESDGATGTTVSLRLPLA